LPAEHNQHGHSTTVVANESLWSIAGRAIDWLLGQQGNTILLIAILAAIAYLGWYSINHAIPAHLSQIQAGYERIEKSQTDQIDKVTGAFERRENKSEDLLRDLLDLQRRKARGVPADQ